jgi:serine/threonine-protein kinase
MSEQSASQSLPKPGDLIAGKYRIEKIIGQGGMGAVFSAQHEILLQKVAVKVLLGEVAQSQEAVQRFLNEGRNAARIQGEHVCRVSDCGVEGGMPFMVLEFMDGQDLAQVLETRGRLSTEEAVDYVLQSLEAIHQAHQLGIVHRDLKPSNLFLHRRPDGSAIVKVLDFGISKASSLSAAPAALTSTKAMLGSPLYMSPEQLRSSKSVNHRADIWALGVILYELITGTVPYTGENLGELFAAILETDPIPLRSRVPDVPPALDAVVMSCLQRREENRIPSVAELARALAPFATQRSANLSLVLASRAGGPSPYAATTAPRSAMPSFSGAVQTGSGQHSSPGLPAQGSSTVSGVNLPVAVPPGGAVTPSGAGARYGATTPMPGLMQAPNGSPSGELSGGELSAGQYIPPKKSSALPVIIVGAGLFVLVALGGAALGITKYRGAKPADTTAATAPLPTMDLPSASVALNTIPVPTAPSAQVTPPGVPSGIPAGPGGAVADTTPPGIGKPRNGQSSRPGSGGGTAAAGTAAGGSVTSAVAVAPPPPPVTVVTPPPPPPPATVAHPPSTATKPPDVFGGRN